MADRKVATSAHWIVILASAGLEAAWALALDASQGFTVLVPTLIFCVTSPLSMVGLGYAMRGLPISVAYAVWTGLGAALTVAVSFLMGTDEPSLLKVLFLAGIVGCVIGLKFAEAPGERAVRERTRAGDPVRAE